MIGAFGDSLMALTCFEIGHMLTEKSSVNRFVYDDVAPTSTFCSRDPSVEISILQSTETIGQVCVKTCFQTGLVTNGHLRPMSFSAQNSHSHMNVMTYTSQC